MHNAPTQFLRVQDACAIYGISRATLYRRAAEPGSPIRLVKSGRTLVEKASMDRWIASLPAVTPSSRRR